MHGPHEKPAAFTLIELLVVLSIVAVLAAVLLPIFNTITLRADRVTALSQMRQISTGIVAYTGDHNGKFPGPLFPGQMPMLDPARDGRLVLTLAPYLGITIPATPRLIPLFIPPAYRRTVTPAFLNDARTYVLNMAVPVANGTATLNPWGNATLTGQQPLACALVPGGAWAFSDADQLHPRVTGAPWKANTPPGIIHGARRLAVRFDGSAGEIDDGELALPATP